MIEYSNLKSYNQIWTPMGRYPMIDNTIFETYQEALTFATNNAVAVVGSVITVTNDTDSNRNGVYLLIYTGETPLSALSQPTGLEKLGSDIDLSNYVTTETLNNELNTINNELNTINYLIEEHLDTIDDLYEILMSGNTNILDFKGFVENIEISQGSPMVNVGNDIYFDLTNKLFIIKYNLNYYNSWDGSIQYQELNESETIIIKDDVLFRYDNIYKWDGENLIDIFGNSKYLNEFIDAEDNEIININLDNNNKNICIFELTNSNTINFLCKANKTNTSYNIILLIKDTIPTLNLDRILLKKHDNITPNSRCIISIKYFIFNIPNGGNAYFFVGNLINLTNPSKIYTYKGSVDNFSDLNDKTPQEGDVYNIINNFTIDEKSYPSGTNVAWVALSEIESGHWDALGGSITNASGGDLSDYAKKEYVDAAIEDVTNDGMIYDIYAKWEDILQKTFPLSINLSASPTISEYTAINQTVNLTWTCKRDGINLIPSNVKVTQGENVIYNETPSYSSGTISASVAKEGATSFKATITAEGITKDATTSHSRVLPIFYGFSTKGSPFEDMKEDLDKYIASNFNVTKTINNSVLNGYLVIALPDGKLINTIKSGGFDVPMSSVVTDTYNVGGTNYSYNIYYSSNPIKLGDMTIVVTTK